MNSTPATALWDTERPRLQSLAYRVLGSWHDAEDVVQQVWELLHTVNLEEVRKPAAWLTTVTTHAAIDEARRQRSRRESYVGPWLPEPVSDDRLPDDVAVGRGLLEIGLLRLMETLEPADRAIFVLREAFDVPYAEIAECLGRSPAACRQVVSRARRSLSAAGHEPDARAARDQEERRLIAALAAAVVGGDVDNAVRLVSEDCVLWSDGGGVTKAALKPVQGDDNVVRFLIGIAGKSGLTQESATWVRVNGQLGLWFGSPSGDRLVTIEHVAGRVSAIHLHANPAKLGFVT